MQHSDQTCPYCGASYLLSKKYRNLVGAVQRVESLKHDDPQIMAAYKSCATALGAEAKKVAQQMLEELPTDRASS
jgi:hypothetical protein